MKMKIDSNGISMIIILVIVSFQPAYNFKVRLTGYNPYENREKESDFYNNQIKNNNNNFDNQDLHHSRNDWDSQDDTEMSNLEIRNQIYSHSTEPILRTYDDNSSSSSSSSSSNYNGNSNQQKYVNPITNSNSNTNANSNESPKFLSRMISGPPQQAFPVPTCPCASLVKCQPCGLIPDLDFTNRNKINCPCAPKLNCPACPPLSLIHEIAAKKVNYIFK